MVREVGKGGEVGREGRWERKVGMEGGRDGRWRWRGGGEGGEVWEEW